MPRNRLPFLVASVPVAILLGLPVVAAPPARPGPEAPIRLRASTFLPSRGEPAVPAGLRARRVPEGERGTWLVQFSGPVRSTWKDALAATGADLLEYVPDFAFKVRMTPAQARRASRLESVRWVGPFHPAYKLSTRLVRAGERLYTVRLERRSDAARAASAIVAAGGRLVSRQGETLVVSAPAARLESLAAIGDVAWIENLALRKKYNEYGGGRILGADIATAAGFEGSTQTVAVADTGIGGGTPATAHRDIPASRIAAIFNRPGAAGGCFASVVDDGARDVDTGHGTHTTSSILSGGDSAGRGTGTAPEAHLVFQAVENYATISTICQILYGLPNGYYLTGLPTDLRQLYQQAYSAGARIHSNSWGSDVAGQYTADAANTDDFVWSHRDLTVTFSAGNAGVDADGNGGVDGDSMGSPATAKNVIAVGASENDRQGNYPCDVTKFAVCVAQGGNNALFTYGEAWPFDFPAPPLKNDPSAGNAEQMAAFSSRGPTDDGRIKPDIVAPGTWVLSGFSDLYQEGYDTQANPQTGLYQYDGWGYPLDDKYKYMGGTSMANPLVAGAAAAVRDFFEKVHAHAASAALVKATLVNSAVDLLDENNDGADDNDMPIPNVYEGWGRVNLAAATDGSRQFADEGAGLVTGGSAVFSYDVSSGTPFKVTLAWTDYPGTQSATRMLVNDLDLEVESPDGTLFRGNVFGGGESSWGGLPDRVNNLENVFITAPPPGTWTVTVRGYNVPQGPQPFALVVAGNVGTGPVDTPPTVTITDPPAGAVVSGTVTVRADATDDGVVTQVEFFVDGASIGTDSTSPWAVTWDTSGESNGPHTVRAVATDDGGQMGENAISVTVDNGSAPTSAHVGDLDGVSGPWDSRRWRADVTIAVVDDTAQPVAGATVSGTWSTGSQGTTSCVTDASGRCGVFRRISNRRASVRWTVTAVSHPTLTYDSSANSDPDGDSDGTRITVTRP